MYALAEAFLYMYMYSCTFHKGTKIQLKGHTVNLTKVRPLKRSDFSQIGHTVLVEILARVKLSVLT